MKRTVALLTAMLAAVGCTNLDANAAKVNLKGDVNRDSVINTGDMVLLAKYLTNQGEMTEQQYTSADFNGDSSVDSFDMLRIREYFTKYRNKVPKGSWIGTGFDGTRYFWFGESQGNFVQEESNKGSGFSFVCKNGELLFENMGENGESCTLPISWIDENHFSVLWDSENSEVFTYYRDKMIDYDDILTGTYTTSGGKGSRYFKIKGISGTYTDENTDKITNFSYNLSGENISFNFRGKIENAKFSRTDKDHFTIVWSDGSAEKFTRREIKTENGVTYVNGILIANKTYGLPEDYDPGDLTKETMLAFSEMQSAAYADGLSLWVCSGYRSYYVQNSLYNYYVSIDGKNAADTYSARAGHSEHQTGLALDVNYAEDFFEGTPEAKWLAENCWKYGFIIRYPKGKQNITGYIYEPWHIRYLGKEYAKAVYDSGLTLEEYLDIPSVYTD